MLKEHKIFKKPLVSVLITVYNGYPYVVNTINSLINQTYEPVEIIVVDDGSIDQTASALSKLKQLYENLKVIKCQKIGRGRALNVGLAHCDGKYIAINDADDLSLPGRIEKQADFLEKNQDYVLVGSKINMLDLKTGDIRNDAFKERPLSDKEIKNYLMRGQPIQHSTVLVRKTAVLEIGGYNENIKFLFDRDLFVRLMNKGKFLNIDEVLVSLGRHKNQFFFTTFYGLKRIKQDFHYRLMAARNLGETKSKVIRIYIHYFWSIISFPLR